MFGSVIIFEGFDPLEISTQQSRNYGGAQHLRISFLQALIRHSRAESIIIAARVARKQALTAALRPLDPDRRACVLTFSEVVARKHIPVRAVIHCLNPTLAGALHLSMAIGKRTWPVTGMTHDLFDPTVFRDLVLASAATQHPITAIACASRAARAVVSSMLDRITELRGRPWRIALPIVSHGIELKQSTYLSQVDRDQITRMAHYRKLLGLPEDNFIILYIGRLSTETKADLAALVTAFAEMETRGSAILIFAGSEAKSGEASKLRQAAQSVSATRTGRAVVVRANVSEAEKQQLLSAADVFVSPANSFQESFGLALVEAMAAGLPVVASDWNGYRDIIENGRTGFLIPTVVNTGPTVAINSLLPIEDAGWLHSQACRAVSVDIRALRTTLERLEGNRDLRIQVGRDARLEARRFAITHMVRRYDRLWTLLLQRADKKSGKANLGLSYDIGEVFSGHPARWYDGD